jgi:hypothetical protein
MHKIIFALCITALLASCNNTPKEPEAIEIKSTTGNVDTAHYKKFDRLKINFFEEAKLYWQKTPENLDAAKRVVKLSDTTIYGASVKYKPGMGNYMFSLTAFTNGNAVCLENHDSSMVVSNNEKNVQIAVDEFLKTITKYQSLCKKDDTYYAIDEQYKIVFTIFTTKGKYVCIEKVDNYTNPAWTDVMDKMNKVADAVNDNYKAATGKE